MDGLYDFYNEDLRPVLLQQERKRKKLFSNFLKTNIGVALASAALMIVYFRWVKAMSFLEVSLIVGVLGTIYIVWMYKSIIKSHRIEVKQNVLSKVATFIDPSLKYRANSWISGFEVQVSGFFERGSWADVTGEDLITGELHALKFKCSEITLPRFVTEFSEGNLSSVNLRSKGFKGLFAIIELPRRLDSVIYIFPNNFGGKVNRKFSTVSGLERIKLEDPSFERHFNAYATDQLQSRMILTTRLINDITSLRQKMGSDIMLGITGDKLYIAVSSSKDLFEPNVYRSYLSPDHVRESLKELNIVVQLVKDISDIFSDLE